MDSLHSRIEHSDRRAGIYKLDVAYVLLALGPVLFGAWTIYALRSGGALDSPLFGVVYSTWFKALTIGSIVTGFLIALGNRWNRSLLWTAAFGLVALAVSLVTDLLLRTTDLLSSPTSFVFGVYYFIGGLLALYVVEAVIAATLWFARGRRSLVG